MARRLIINLMLLVLVWTGTLLHDAAEIPNDKVTAQSGQAQSAPAFISHDSTLISLLGDDCFPEHVHFAGVVSKRHVLLSEAHTSLPLLKFSESSADVPEGAKKERAPPFTYTISSNRLYIANRRLLI